MTGHRGEDRRSILMSGRDINPSRLEVAHPDGPGLPRRAVEREYLATLSEAVPLDAWREIVAAAVEKAKAGDAKARDWLARYLLGEKPMTLTDLAADEAGGFGVERDIEDRMMERRKGREIADILNALRHR